MKSVKSRALLVASLAGILALPAIGLAQSEGKETAHCYGVNKCKATGDCGGKGHSCGGLLAIPIIVCGLLSLLVGVFVAAMWIGAAIAVLYHTIELRNPAPDILDCSI